MGFDASERDDVVELLVQCIEQLSPKQKSVLALYYHEDLEPAEIATCLGLTRCEIDQVRAEAVGLLQSVLAAQIGLPELPASFEASRHGSFGVCPSTTSRKSTESVNPMDTERLKLKLRELRRQYPAASFQWIWNKALEELQPESQPNHNQMAQFIRGAFRANAEGIGRAHFQSGRRLRHSPVNRQPNW